MTMQVAPGVDDHDVPGLGVVEGMAVQLPLGAHVPAPAIDVLAHGHELRGCRRAARRWMLGSSRPSACWGS